MESAQESKSTNISNQDNFLSSLKINSVKAKQSMQNVLNIEKSIMSGQNPELSSEDNILLDGINLKQLTKKQASLKKQSGKNSYKNSDIFSNNLIKINTSKANNINPDSFLNDSSFGNQDSEILNKSILGEQSESKHRDFQPNQSQFLNIARHGEQGAGTNNIIGKNVVHLSSFDNTSSLELINKITTYIEQNNFANNDQLNLTVHHKELGQFDIRVNNNQQAQGLDITINSASKEGNNFFHVHEKQLVMKLQQAGIELNDFKIVSRTVQLDSAKNSSDSMFNNRDSHQDRGSSSYQQGSNQQDADSKRRNSQWEEYRERYYA
jgi:hypothetical protein